MKDWQLFEQECCTYLNSVLKDYPFTFKCSGGSNSNASDIEVMKNNKSVFFHRSKAVTGSKRSIRCSRR